MRTIASFAAIGLTVTICTGPVNAADQEILGTNWQIESVKNAGEIDRLRTSLTIARDGTIAATVGCNRMIGRAKIDGSTIEAGRLAATRMACPEPLMTQEQALAAAIEAARTFKLNDDTLWLFDAGGAELIVLRKAPAPVPAPK